MGTSFAVDFACAIAPRPPVVGRDAEDPYLYRATMADPHGCALTPPPPPLSAAAILAICGAATAAALAIAIVCVFRRRRAAAAAAALAAAAPEAGAAAPLLDVTPNTPSKRAAPWARFLPGCWLRADESEPSASGSPPRSDAPGGWLVEPNSWQRDGAEGAGPRSAERATSRPATEGRGLARLLGACGVRGKLPAAQRWCEEQARHVAAQQPVAPPFADRSPPHAQGWESVAQLRGRGGERAAAALAEALGLKPRGTRATRCAA